MSEWYEQPYPTGAPVGPALPRNLYPPGTSTPSSDGPDVKAWKRGLCRAGRWMPWDTSLWDDSYSKKFAYGRSGNVGDTGISGFQRQMRLADDGVVGPQTYEAGRTARIPTGLPHSGEPIFDSVCCNLLEQAWQRAQAEPPKTKADVQAAMADYCRRSVGNEPKIHYQQVRPIACFGVPPESGFTTDCSGHSTCVYYWARQQTGVAVPDPNPGNGYNGYGYTGTLVANPKCSSPYQVGDLGIYGTSTGNTTHVVTCYEAGDGNSSLWCSHGSEAAPYPVRLHYRSDLLCVVRPPIMP